MCDKSERKKISIVFILVLVQVGVITPYPVFRNVPVPVKQIVKVPIHIPQPVPVERRVSKQFKVIDESVKI